MLQTFRFVGVAACVVALAVGVLAGAAQPASTLPSSSSPTKAPAPTTDPPSEPAASPAPPTQSLSLRGGGGLSIPRRRALLIGVGQATYKGIEQTPLPQCVIDAKTLAATLGPRGYSCRVVADGEGVEPTAAKVRDEVAALCAAVSEADTLLIYISTHGDVIGGKSVIIARDDAVEIEWIKGQMAASRAALRILMLDCCRNDKGFEKTATEVRDVHCILACRPDQLSQVGQSGMSVFTEALVDALVECRADRVKDGKIELDELMYFLERQVPVRAAAVVKDKPQNPTRTVVDPKTVTPVFATCTTFDRLSFGPDAYKDLEPGEARTDLALADLTFLHVQRGMTVEQATESLAKHGNVAWTKAPVLDDKGAGLGIVEGQPSAKDVLVVRFVDKKVALAHVLYTELCEEPYSDLRTRAAIERLVGKGGGSDVAKGEGKKDTGAFAEGSLAALAVPLKGLSPAEIVEKLGCPDSALLPTGQFSDAPGELRYPHTPRPSQMLVIRINAGVFEAVDLVVMD
ncbi:MAG: caspase domain-containing protein [Phycisphaerales bacterium]